MYDISYLKEAEIELKKIIKYYDSIEKHLGFYFDIAVEKTEMFILQNPNLMPKDEKNGTRAISIQGFPYKIIFKEKNNIIWIIAIFHQRMLPNYWNNRLRK